MTSPREIMLSRGLTPAAVTLTKTSLSVILGLAISVMFRSQSYDVALLENDSKTHFNWLGIISWILATTTGFLFTNNAIWNGPFAHGIFRNNSLGVFVSAIIAIICMLLWKVAVPNKKGA